MSIQAVGWVLDWSPARGTDRLVLIAIANHAGTNEHNGAWEAWPGIDTIAREAGLERERTVQEALKRLIDAGHLERVINGAPDGRIRKDRRPNLYRILTVPRGDAPPHPAPEHGVTSPRTPSPVDNPPDGVTPDGTPSNPRGDAPASNGVTPHDTTGCREASPEPSGEPSLNQPPSPPSAEPALVVHTSGGATTDQQQHSPATTGPERRDRIRAACRLLAERDVPPTPRIGSYDAYIAPVVARLVARHEPAGHRHLVEHPDLPPAALADLLAPTGTDPDTAAQARARQRRAEEDTLRGIRDTLAQPADRIRSAEHAARLRDSLRQPRGAL